MAANFSKNKTEMTEAEKILANAQQHKQSRPEFTIKGKSFYIEKWPHLELWERLPLVANLFLVPMAAGIEGYDEETGTAHISEVDVMGVLFSRLQDQYVGELLQDLSSCVYVKSTNDQIDLNKDLEDAGDICIVIREVLKNCFLFLFNGGFTEILHIGSEISQVNQTLSPSHSNEQ